MFITNVVLKGTKDSQDALPSGGEVVTVCAGLANSNCLRCLAAIGMFGNKVTARSGRLKFRRFRSFDRVLERMLLVLESKVDMKVIQFRPGCEWS